MESRYTRKLYQQEDIITTLNEQVDYLITQQQIYRKFLLKNVAKKDYC
jgi:hypothetical protein